MASKFQIGRQNEARSIKLDEAEGWLCWKPTRSRFSWKSNVDIFGAWDYIAIRKEQLKFVQVTANYVSTQRKRELSDFVRQFGLVNSKTVLFELHVWRKLKRQGNKWVVRKLFLPKRV